MTKKSNKKVKTDKARGKTNLPKGYLLRTDPCFFLFKTYLISGIKQNGERING